MSKQTAVEQLKQDIDLEIKSGTKMVVNWDMYLALEKEQIIKAFGNKVSKTIKQGIDVYETISGEQYYNETYGGNND
jgi:hypothetical protein